MFFHILNTHLETWLKERCMVFCRRRTEIHSGKCKIPKATTHAQNFFVFDKIEYEIIEPSVDMNDTFNTSSVRKYVNHIPY